MDYRYIPPPLPTLKRLSALRRHYPGQSTLRMLEYETLASKPLAGHVLDVGGGRKARYIDHLPADITIVSVNIDPAIEPTHVVPAGKPFPIPDDSIDAAISFNTLEHVYDARFLLAETLRVMKPGATAHITVPFIFRVHAHPDDYFRGTPSWWAETLRQVGFARAELTPLIWGRYTTAGMITSYRGLIPRSIQNYWAHVKDVLYAAVVFRRDTHYAGRRGDRICAVSPGWFISATKARGAERAGDA